jgi:hypothetical protein
MNGEESVTRKRPRADNVVLPLTKRRRTKRSTEQIRLDTADHNSQDPEGPLNDRGIKTAVVTSFYADSRRKKTSSGGRLKRYEDPDNCAEQPLYPNQTTRDMEERAGIII